MLKGRRAISNQPSPVIRRCPAVRRIALPSGGWWEISTRPLWKHVRDWPHEGADLIDHALTSLTIAWSFSEEIGVGTIAGRDADDLIAVIEAFREDVAPHLLDARHRVELAQRLFACMVVGQIPREFEEAHIMAATGWSWQALQATPADVVQRVTIYLAVREARANQGSLEFPRAEGEEQYE